MLRRAFLKLLGLAPVAAIAPAVTRADNQCRGFVHGPGKNYMLTQVLGVEWNEARSEMVLSVNSQPFSRLLLRDTQSGSPTTTPLPRGEVVWRSESGRWVLVEQRVNV